MLAGEGHEGVGNPLAEASQIQRGGEAVLQAAPDFPLMEAEEGVLVQVIHGGLVPGGEDLQGGGVDRLAVGEGAVQVPGDGAEGAHAPILSPLGGSFHPPRGTAMGKSGGGGG